MKINKTQFGFNCYASSNCSHSCNILKYIEFDANFFLKLGSIRLLGKSSIKKIFQCVKFILPIPTVPTVPMFLFTMLFYHQLADESLIMVIECSIFFQVGVFHDHQIACIC